MIRSEFIKAPGRRVEVYSLVNSPSVRLLDIPTTLGALRDTAIARLGRGITVDMEPAQFQELQTDEIAQFYRALNGFISSGPDSSVDVRKRVKVSTGRTRTPRWPCTDRGWKGKPSIT